MEEVTGSMKGNSLHGNITDVSLRAKDRGFTLSYSKKVPRKKRQGVEFDEPYRHEYMEEAYEDIEGAMNRMKELLGKKTENA